MLKNEIDVLIPLIKTPWNKMTFKEIKKATGKKSDSYVYNSIQRFVKKKILKKEKVGNVVQYKLELTKPKARIYTSIIMQYFAWNKKLPFVELNDIISKIPTNFFIFIITGSYANGKQTKTSDIDVVIINDNSFNSKKIYAELKHACDMSIPKIHLYVFKEKEFLQMLINKKQNYGKEIAKNNLILSGANMYYKIVSEAMQHGFNG